MSNPSNRAFSEMPPTTHNAITTKIFVTPEKETIVKKRTQDIDDQEEKKPRSLFVEFATAAEDDNNIISPERVLEAHDNNDHPEQPEANDDEASVSSVKSTRQNHGTYGDDGQDVPWKGCVCGELHKRPTKVFWVQCDGPCQSWYNVTSICVDGITPLEAAHDSFLWNCPACLALWQHQPFVSYLLQEMPPEILFRILEFTAKPTYRAAVLGHQIAPLNSMTRRFVHGDKKSRGIWECILQRDYHPNPLPSSSSEANMTTLSSKKRINRIPSRRASKRRRKRTNFLSPCELVSASQQDHPRQLVQQEHLLLLGRTEEAYYAIETLADPQDKNGVSIASTETSERTLTLNRLKHILRQNSPIDVDRPSPCTGRTMLQVVCAGEMAEGTVVSCVQHLLSSSSSSYAYGANPNLYSTQEEPFANRPAIYFAISRVMPNLVRELVQAGAHLNISSVQGKLRMTFDSSRIVEGSFTPLEFAKLIKRIEVVEATSNRAPPYWISRLNSVITVLEAATPATTTNDKQASGC